MLKCVFDEYGEIAALHIVDKNLHLPPNLKPVNLKLNIIYNTDMCINMLVNIAHIYKYKPITKHRSIYNPRLMLKR